MNSGDRPSPPTEAELRRRFDDQPQLTVGIEEEVMLLDPETGDLAPLAPAVLRRVEGDPRFKAELPAAQLEILTSPEANVGDAVDLLATARRELAHATTGLVELATAGVHPWAPAEGELSKEPRYEHVRAEYGSHARRQLVFALQVHVAPGTAKRALALYNSLRSFLPEIAALAANAPFHQGRDTGLASIRPEIASLLPRQGVPPPLASWGEYSAALRWGAVAGAMPDPSTWWWELRPHPRFGTLELRVPDAQTTVAEAAGVAAFAQCLAAMLAERLDAGEPLGVAPSWRITENRWRAARDGIEGQLADLVTGERRSTRGRLEELLAELRPAAARLGCEAQLAQAERLVEENGALRQRAVATTEGLDGLVRWLARRWLSDA
jgi:glutamate---cysteine ligase / carboxylate-amine ligase